MTVKHRHGGYIRKRAKRVFNAGREIRICPKRQRRANRDTKIVTGQHSEGRRSTGKYKGDVGGAVTRIDGGRKYGQCHTGLPLGQNGDINGDGFASRVDDPNTEGCLGKFKA